MRYPRLALPLIYALILTACGGGGGEGGGPTEVEPGPLHQATVAAVSGTRNSRLPCNREQANAQCDLRVYQIMVESFIDGNPAANFNTGYGTSHHKGDLQGIINSLDYIKSTGVNAIWLTPVFHSVPIDGQDSWTDRLDATGYFASNYFSVDPRFGTNEQFKTLVDEAHERGLYVLMDGVFGHYKANMVASPTGKLPANGVCVNENGGIYSPGTNTACADFTKPETLAFFKEVIEYWTTNYKIDGWRLDQGYQVPLSAWRELRQTVESTSAEVSYVNGDGETVQPLAHMVSEIWSGEGTIAARAYGSTDNPALQSAFHFPGRYRLVQTLATEEWGLSSGNMNLPATALRGAYDTYSAYPDHAMPNLMLGNHDLVRFGDLIQRASLGEPSQQVYWARHRAAFAFMAAHSGPVTLYYGDEIGQQVASFAQRVETECAVKGLCDDHVARSSGKVSGLDANQTALKNYVATLMNLRDSEPALARGARTHVYADSNIYIDRKDYDTNRILFVLNAKHAPARITLDASVVGGASTLQGLAGTTSVSASSGSFVIELPPLAAGFYRF